MDPPIFFRSQKKSSFKLKNSHGPLNWDELVYLYTYMNGDIFYGKLVGKLYHRLSSLGLLNGNVSPKQLLFFGVNCPISFTVNYFSPTIFVWEKNKSRSAPAAQIHFV